MPDGALALGLCGEGGGAAAEEAVEGGSSLRSEPAKGVEGKGRKLPASLLAELSVFAGFGYLLTLQDVRAIAVG